MLSIDDLVKKAYKPEEKTITVKIERMNGEIELRVPFLNEWAELREKHQKALNLKEGEKVPDTLYNDVMLELVYINSVNPKLNDDKLIEHFNCKDKPYMVVKEVFGEEIAYSLANLLIENREADSNIYLVKKMADEVKNS